MTEDGATALDGDLPGELLGRRAVVEPDRRVGHAPLRRGRAAGARARPASTRSTAPARALGHAYGGGAQYFAMWVVGSPSHDDPGAGRRPGSVDDEAP